MAEIAIGSKVRLKSGGPIMTVDSYGTKMDGVGMKAVSVDDPELVNCKWFDGTKLEYEAFSVKSLYLDNGAPLGIYTSK